MQKHEEVARVDGPEMLTDNPTAATAPAEVTDRGRVQDSSAVHDMREAIRNILQRRGVDIIRFARERDRDVGYQIGMLLDNIARIVNVPEPSWTLLTEDRKQTGQGQS